MATILETNVIFLLHMVFSALLSIPVLLMIMEEFTGATPFQMVKLEIHGQTVTWILADMVSKLCLHIRFNEYSESESGQDALTANCDFKRLVYLVDRE